MQNLPGAKAIAFLCWFGRLGKFYELLAMQDSEDLLVTFISFFVRVDDDLAGTGVTLELFFRFLG